MRISVHGLCCGLLAGSAFGVASGQPLIAIWLALVSIGGFLAIHTWPL